MNFSVISRPSDSGFHIHSADCADVKKELRQGGIVEQYTADDVDQVVAQIHDELVADFGDEAQDFGYYPLPCARKAGS